VFHAGSARLTHRIWDARGIGDCVWTTSACYAGAVLGEEPAFGALLKRYRLAAGLTHEALAERAAVSVRAISDLERGVSRAPRSETVALLVQALPLAPGQRAALAEAGRRAAPQQASGALHNLPTQLTSFVGRERVLRVAADLLCRQDVRLLTVTGTGGTGKTRFAIELAMGALGVFPAGVCFVALAPVSGADSAVPAIARALGAADADRRTGLASLVELIDDRGSLLVLDNFEHLLAAAPIVVELLRACPGVKILATSRAPLRVSGEHVFPILPLPLPALADLPSLDHLGRNPAVALFVDRATSARPDFALEPDNAAAVAAICNRLDGLPLALELAAARVRGFPPQGLLARLVDAAGAPSLRLLTRGARDLPRRQQSLRDTIAWSYELLPPVEQRLFRSLAVFVGGCTVEAVEAVCCQPATGEQPPIDVVDGLASLVDNSLLQQREGPYGEPRLVMLETIRAFAWEQLAAHEEAPALRHRHARYFLSLLEATGALLFAGARKRLRYAAEQDNLQAALRWLVTQG
jgi:predicted ATPase/transcriptional regulator with XRE-family HTH domain